MTEDEYNMMDALGQVCDYFFETESIVTEVNPDGFDELENEYFGNIKRARKVFDDMYLQYGAEYEERAKERGAVLDPESGNSMYELCQTLQHKSITTVHSLYFAASKTDARKLN